MKRKGPIKKLSKLLTKRKKTTTVKAQMPPRRIWRPLFAVL